jgi:hypothetical protein
MESSQSIQNLSIFKKKKHVSTFENMNIKSVLKKIIKITLEKIVLIVKLTKILILSFFKLKINS